MFEAICQKDKKSRIASEYSSGMFNRPNFITLLHFTLVPIISLQLLPRVRCGNRTVHGLCFVRPR